MKLLALLSIVVLFLLSCNNSQSNADRHFWDTSNLQPVNAQHFTQGQILLPDYACTDTLIVRDADGLNKALDTYEGFEGDSACDSVFHVYCDYYVGSFEDQCSKLNVLQPTWDSLQIVTAIKED